MSLESLRFWMADLAGVIFPHVCEICGSSLVHGEHTICLACRSGMPRTGLHRQPFNIMHQRVAGHVPVERAGGYFYYYREDGYARLIHRAKYNNRPSIAGELAADYAREISPDGFFDGIDLILPVPIHWWKRLLRGYNQTDYIADGISEVTGLPVGQNLKARRGHSSQTRKGAFQRWLNVQNLYEAVRPHELDGKHVLVVDDVMTTGATLLSCIEEIHRKSPSARISILTLAVTHLR